MDPRQADLTGSSSPVGAPEPFQDRSKNPSIFQSMFEPILVQLCLPKWLPNPQKIIQKSIQNRIWSERRDFLKNSTSPRPRRDTHFGGSRVPKTLQKSPKNAPETDKKSNQKFDQFFNGFFNDFSSIWYPFGLPLGGLDPRPAIRRDLFSPLCFCPSSGSLFLSLSAPLWLHFGLL